MDHVGSFLDGANLLGPFFVERDFALLFQRHHDFDSVQRIGAQVDKLGVRGDGVEVGAELLGDDASDLVESVGRLFVCEKKKRIREERRAVRRSVSFFCELYPKQKKTKQRREREREKTYRSGVDGEAGASLGGNSGGLEVNLLCFNGASAKERRREAERVNHRYEKETRSERER